MQKLILDTNIIVSGLISNTSAMNILYDLVLTKKVINCLSNEIFNEYVEVLSRDKFNKFKNFKLNADIVLKRLSDISIFYTINTTIEILADKVSNFKFTIIFLKNLKSL